MFHRFRKLLIALVVVFFLAMITVLVSFTSQPPPRPPLPNPNGYDDFLKASGMIGRTTGSFIDLDHDGLRAFVSSNAESLRWLRLGLTRQCALPMDSALTNLNQLSAMKKLVQLLSAEGRLHEMDHRPAEAARSYADAIRFGNEMSRGGFLVTRLVGIAAESIGCRNLAQIVPQLGREDSRWVLKELERVDAGRVAWEEILNDEKFVMRYQMRNRFNPFLRIMGWWQNRQAIQKAETKHKLIMTHERLLAGELALHCYQSEQGHPPARLDEVVTNYLSSVPQDPFTGRPMVYRVEGTNWLLYSAGPDAEDNGGRPAALSSKGDIRFDSLR